MAKTNSNFDINDYKNEIDKYIKERVEKESSSTLVKFYKKRLRNKTIIILIELLIIIALIGGGVVGCIFLYHDGYFNKYDFVIKKTDKPISNETIPDNKETNKDDEKNKLNELVNKYSYLLDNINIDTKSEYLTEFYSGNLTNELKEYLAIQLINNTYITTEDNSSYFEAELLKRAYKELFNEILEYSDFKYDGASYKYLRNKDMFISTTLSTKGNKIIKEITNIEEKDNNVIITTTEAYIKDNKLYNILTNKEISGYKKTDKISKYSKKLNLVKYTFNNDYLISIK